MRLCRTWPAYLPCRSESTQKVFQSKSLKQYINDIKLKVCHWFIVEDLDHLKRGGRISAVAATFGKALQIKPLISVDEEVILLM